MVVYIDECLVSFLQILEVSLDVARFVRENILRVLRIVALRLHLCVRLRGDARLSDGRVRICVLLPAVVLNAVVLRKLLGGVTCAVGGLKSARVDGLRQFSLSGIFHYFGC